MRIVISAACVAVLLAGTVARAGQTDRANAAEAAAKANVVSSAGQAYQESVEKAFGREHGSSVRQCAKSVRRPDLSDFSVFLKVDTEGTVGDVLVRPMTNLSTCVQGKLTKWRMPGAPRAGYWVEVAVKLRRR